MKTSKDHRFNPNYEETRIPVELIRGLGQEDKEKYIAAWKNSSYVFDPIKKVIQEKIEALLLDNHTDYSCPNWAYERADKNGQITQLNYILRLLP